VVLVSLAEWDEPEADDIARRLAAAGFRGLAHGEPREAVAAIRGGEVDLVICTVPGAAGLEIRRSAVECGVASVSSVDTARALLSSDRARVALGVMTIDEYRGGTYLPEAAPAA
jgi:hypothetical protein